MKKLIGYTLLALPFATIYTVFAQNVGYLMALLPFGISAIIASVIYAGVLLID